MTHEETEAFTQSEYLSSRLIELRAVMSDFCFAPHLIGPNMLEDEELLPAIEWLLSRLERYAGPAKREQAVASMAYRMWGHNSKVH